ncbi:ATP-binding cassette domain-containing protein [Paenibacillus sp. TRM 82003]|nr:ATP-binding cassette domain-containing protein [Paenibacillus sp. TRM 82003]
MSLEGRSLSVIEGGKTLLDAATFAIPDHAITLVVGKTGAGKSTLLRALSGLVRPSEGDVLYEGRPLWRGGRLDRTLLLRNAVAFQFPEQQLFARTVQGEFDFSLRPYRLPKAERQRRTAEALAGQRLPASFLDASPHLLSGGQKRRVALASILSSEAPWLLLDEPSAGLDAASLAKLTEELQRWRRSCGIVLATHDLDAFLPIADRVLIVHRGRIAANVAPAQLAADPSPLLRCGVGLPESLATAAALREAGLPLPAAPMSPERLAAALAGALRGERTAAAEVPRATAPATTAAEPNDDAPPPTSATSDSRSLLYAMDPSRKWLVYTAVSIGIILQTGWIGLGVALAFALCCWSALAGEDRTRLLRMTRPLLWLMVVAVLFSGLQWPAGGDGVGFSFDAAIETFRRLSAFLEITVLGLAFTLSTSASAMKSGLERMLRPLRRFRVPVETLALTASLVLRFIPLIMEEADRFALIAKARGKRAPKRGTIAPRDLPVFVIPLLISLFQAVEDMILAMEMKGWLQSAETTERTGTTPAAPPRLGKLAARPSKERLALAAGWFCFFVLLSIRLFGEGWV